MERVTMSRMMLLIAGVILVVTAPVIDGQLVYSYNPEIQNGGNITVQWRNPGRGETVGSSDKDEVRLYCPQVPVNNSLYDNAFIDRWSILEASTSRNPTGTTGNISVGPIINMRDTCQLIFFRWVPQFGFHLPFTTGFGENILVRFPHRGSEPLQGHIAMTGNPSELRVTWVSTDVSDQDPAVWYRKQTDPDSKAVKKQAAATTYAAGDMCGGEAAIVYPTKFRDPGIIYSAVMTGLTPNTAYTYWYGSGVNSTRTRILSPKQILTSPQAITNTGQQTTCRMIAFADMGAWGGSHFMSLPTDSTAKSVVDLIQRMWINTGKKIDMIGHVGDISYAIGKGYVWERFFYRVEPIATQVPYHVGIGNHEYDHTSTTSPNDPSGVEISYNPSWGNYGDDSGGECGVPMAKRFHMPQSPGSNGVFWYSVDVANVHFVMISTEHDLSPGSVQYNWLRYDLNAVNRATQPWVIVAGHRPLYNNEQRQQDADLPVQRKLREFLNPVFAEFGVNLYVCGHYHNYVRTTPISRDGSVTSVGTVHITVGTGGADLGAGQYRSVPWAVKSLTTFGVISIETAGTQIMTVQFVNSSGSVLDFVAMNQLPHIIVKPSTQAPSTTQASTTPSTNKPAAECSNKTAVIVGVVMGLAVLVMAAIIVFLLWRRYRNSGSRTDGFQDMSDGRPLEEDF
eukprot:scpid33377/ scgid3577/ Probable inactive purple acid phosphatase 2